jgi:hypothetical protein
VRHDCLPSTPSFPISCPPIAGPPMIDFGSQKRSLRAGGKRSRLVGHRVCAADPRCVNQLTAFVVAVSGSLPSTTNRRRGPIDGPPSLPSAGKTPSRARRRRAFSCGPGPYPQRCETARPSRSTTSGHEIRGVVPGILGDSILFRAVTAPANTLKRLDFPTCRRLSRR